MSMPSLARKGSVDLPGAPGVDRPVPGAHLQLPAPDWLLRHRVTVPARGVNYFDRPELIRRCTPSNQHVTLLMAPGGFGKTTLLAECCRRVIEIGIRTAWLVLDEQDGPATLDTYLAFALHRAGLDILKAFDSGDAGVGPHTRTRLLVRAIEAFGGPCVLALDELERLTDPDSVAVLNYLIRNGPPGLHLAMACRELPVGLDIAAVVLDGHAEVVTVDDLRFSKPEIARFFDLKLSRRELAAVAEDSAGWPIALRICRNERGQGLTGEALVMRDVVENWAESRLWYCFSDEDRELLLDIGLFEWIDSELLDEVLDEPGGMSRIEGMSALAGLLEPVDDGRGNVKRLHPLVRDHCAKKRRRQTPERYRSIHSRISRALARRGETVMAVHHAAEAAEPALIGTILTEAGGLRLWLREGADRLIAVDRFLTNEVLETHPHLAMMRCVALSYAGRLPDARQVFAAATRDGQAPSLDTDLEAHVDRCLAHAMVCHNGCESVGAAEFRAVLDECARLSEMPHVDPILSAAMELGLCIGHGLKAEFDVAQDWGMRAQQTVAGSAPYVSMGVEFQFGQVAMAQGRVGDAMAWYRRGLRASKAGFLRDPRLAVLGQVLQSELNLERNRVVDAAKAVQVARELRRNGTQFAFFAAASDVATDLAMQESGVERALAVVDELLGHALQTDLPALARHLAAVRVAVLALARRVDEADRTWRVAQLPETDAGCLELQHQSWREMESLSCARLRLLIARGNLEPAGELAHKLLEVASLRGLRRTHMRALVLAMESDCLGGDRVAAVGRLAEFLALFAETDYARPLVRATEYAPKVLQDFLDTNADSPFRSSAEALLAATTERTAAAVPQLSSRERDVLRRLESQRDKEIAAAMGLTAHGVRYHIRNIFDKLHANGRLDAVRRARAMRLLPPM